MKYLKRLLALLAVSAAALYGAVTVTDDFESGLNGWSGEGAYTTYYADPVNSNVLRMDTEEVWVEKTYQLGSLNANTEVTVDFDMWGIGGWESGRRATDYFSVRANGDLIIDRTTIDTADGKNLAAYQHFTITATTDENGLLKLGFSYDVSAPDDEDCIIDNIVVLAPNEIAVPADAVDDEYTTLADNPLVDNLLSNDLGLDIYILSYTEPSHGTLAISSDGNFTYTPNIGFIGDDTFTYTISDQNGSTDSATVYIVVDPKITEGAQIPFYIVNPPRSRNIVGDYKLAGNTVLCLTELTTGFGGTCHGDDNDYLTVTSNNQVTKYLDIDDDPSTWNSTSSYIVVPDTYDPDRGVLWAGLFWQGRISTEGTYPKRYAIENGSTFDYVDIVNNSAGFDIRTSGALDIKLKINEGSYNDVIASNFHIYQDGTYGQTYAAFADITSLFLENPLQFGKNIFQVANLTTMEGRESRIGTFGGWALVVIYAEDYREGTPKNISIYNGFVSIGTNDDPIEVSGFKLPESGEIKAKIAVFSGEGEYLYGRTDTNNAADWMKISDNETDGYDYFPGLVAGTGPGNRDNMFDAVLKGVLRDDIEVDGPDGYDNNQSINNVGVDVDIFDVSDLMTQYRDANPDVDTIYIKTYSNNDYITPSMIAFSSELYQPNICYDYTFDIGGYVLDSAENDINTSLHLAAPQEPLRTHLLIRSLEGDFTLSDAELTVSVADPRQLSYIAGSSAIATYDINEYEPSADKEHAVTDTGFSLYFGVDATPDKGGTLDSFQSHYILFDYETNSSWPRLETTLSFDVNFTVNYGSGPVTIYKHLDANSRCPTSTLYAPEWGIFNIISDPADPNSYSLLTQVSGRSFDVHGVFYDADYTTPKSVSTSIEVELINANFFKTDTNASCYNPDSNITQPIFTSFSNSSVTAAIPNNPDFALRNSAFRVWYLEDNQSRLVTNTCSSANDETCYKTLYETSYISFDKNCTAVCSDINMPGCYSCLKKYYGRPLCSRDNFSIRPETFRIILSDQNNNDPAATSVDFFVNDTPSAASLAADYNYSMRLTATRYGSDTAAKRYIQAYGGSFPAGSIGDSTTSVGIVSQFPAGYVCNDTENRTYDVLFWDGSAKATLTHNNVGDYRFFIRDSEWTKVDNPGRWGQDCIPYPSAGYSDVPYSGQVGCIISSEYDTTHTDILTSFKAYKFDIDDIEITAPNSSFIYMNTLTDDYNMSIKIKGPIVAKGKNGTVLTNFTKLCYAKDLNLTFSRSLSPDESTLSAPALLRYYDINSSETNTTDLKDIDTIASARFNSGTSKADLAINIDRSSGTAVNPIELNITEIRVGCANLSECETFADQKSDHDAEGNLTFGTTAPFRRFVYYGRLHAPDYRTDKDSISTPIYAEVYCDPIQVNCQDFNITRANGWKESVDDVNWWINPLHTSADGNVTSISATKNFAVYDTDVSVNGTNPYNAFFHAPSGGSYSPTVTYLGSKKPHRARILVSTDPWLRFHRFFADGRVYYDIVFEGAADDWAGIGEAGKSVETNASGSSSRRIEW